MREERVYELRRAILEAHSYYAPVPLSLDDLLRYHRLAFLRPDRELVAVEWNNLAVNGYVEDIPDSNGAYRRITATGLNQVNREVKLDLYIWGRQALTMLVVVLTLFLLATTSLGRAVSPGGQCQATAACSGGQPGGAPCVRFR